MAILVCACTACIWQVGVNVHVCKQLTGQPFHQHVGINIMVIKVAVAKCPLLCKLRFVQFTYDVLHMWYTFYMRDSTCLLGSHRWIESTQQILPPSMPMRPQSHLGAAETLLDLKLWWAGTSICRAVSDCHHWKPMSTVSVARPCIYNIDVNFSSSAIIVSVRYLT